jgi:peptidoglycan hydrolase CwlO-like protein
MPTSVFLTALLSVLGIGAITVITVTRLITARKASSLPPDVDARLHDLEQGMQNIQQELAETQERLDFAERLLSAERDKKRIGG